MQGDKLKTSMFGGFNKRDVLRCVEEITDVYETKNKELEQETQRTIQDLKQKISEVKKQADEEKARQKEEHEKAMANLKAGFDQKIQQKENELSENIKTQKLYFENKLEEQKKENERTVSEIHSKYENERNEIQKKFEAQVIKFKNQHEEQTDLWEKIRKENVQLLKDLESGGEAYEQKRMQAESLKQINRDLDLKVQSMEMRIRKYENIIGEVNSYETRRKSEIDRQKELAISESDDILSSARREADLLLDQAKSDAQRITGHAYEKSRTMIDEAKEEASHIMSEAEFNSSKILKKTKFTLKAAGDGFDILRINLDEIKNNINEELKRAVNSIEDINVMVENAKSKIVKYEFQFETLNPAAVTEQKEKTEQTEKTEQVPKSDEKYSQNDDALPDQNNMNVTVEDDSAGDSASNGAFKNVGGEEGVNSNYINGQEFQFGFENNVITPPDDKFFR